MKDQINTIREALGKVIMGDVDAYNRLIAALDALEAAMREPVQLDHIACIDGGKLRYMTGRKAPAYDCELYAMPDGKRAPKLYAAPVAQQPQAEAAPPGYALVPVEPDEMWAYRVIRHHQPNLDVGCKAWLECLKEMLHWHAAIAAQGANHG